MGSLGKLTIQLKKWNKEVFGNIHARKEDLFGRLDMIQHALATGITDTLINQEEIVRVELAVTLEQEELVWYQKSRQQWITCGDRNTSFFHTSTLIRRQSNWVEVLRVNGGVWCRDQNCWGNMQLGSLGNCMAPTILTVTAGVSACVTNLKHLGYEKHYF